jgi:hypothetical protein
MVAMMKHLGVDSMPGVPDFNQSTIAMGQHLLNPPSVAGWAGGTAWITPGLLIERGNIARDVLIPDMTGFKDWNFTAGTDDVLGQRLRDGDDLRPGRARAGRAVQYPNLGLHRVAAGGAQAHSDSSERGAVQPDQDGAREWREDEP